MPERISRDALERLFVDARTYNAWTGKDVPGSLLSELVDIVKIGPTRWSESSREAGTR